MKILTIVVTWILFAIAPAKAGESDTITLHNCREMAVSNFPTAKQGATYSAILSDIRRNSQTAWLPKMSLNAQASWQSEKIELDIGQMLSAATGIPGPNIPPYTIQEQDQYKFYTEISQMIYDGGAVKAGQRIDEINYKIDTQQVNTDVNKVLERINQIYFGILLYEKKLELLNELEKNLSGKTADIESGIRHDALVQNDLDVLNTEILKIGQQITETRSDLSALIRALGVLTGQVIPGTAIFLSPEPQIPLKPQITRPELDMLKLQKEKADASYQIINTKYLPKVAGFGTLAYGKPSLNMFANEFDAWYIVGIKASWNIWDWNAGKRDKNIISLRKKLIDAQAESFILTTTSALEQELQNQEKFELLIQSDNDIIKLQQRIVDNASSRLNNGVITASDYMKEVYALNAAKINLQIHRLSLQQSKINYLNLSGNSI
ncbi:MAG: TolC family protein [Bacteroidetes bacterium]|nr:TolC family protein [Bacteroidota bacterium]MBU1718847.1 TolC family protein [Bacteroidota bacterium]